MWALSHLEVEAVVYLYVPAQLIKNDILTELPVTTYFKYESYYIAGDGSDR